MSELAPVIGRALVVVGRRSTVLSVGSGGRAVALSGRTESGRGWLAKGSAVVKMRALRCARISVVRCIAVRCMWCKLR